MSALKAINECQQLLVEQGVGKVTARGLNYSFRSIDDLYTHVGRALAKTGLVLMPEVVEIETTERASKSGGVLTHARIKMSYHFRTEDDPSGVSATIIGEAMDAGDKAFSKAQTMAFKTMVLQTFCIPLEGEVDPDAQTYDDQTTEPAPALSESLEADIHAKAEEGMAALQEYWTKELTAEQRKAFGPDTLTKYKKIATQVDLKAMEARTDASTV